MPDPVAYPNIKQTGCRYDCVSLGEVMLRIDPRDVPTARARDNCRIYQGGGETNVACGLAYTFGLQTAVLTALVDDPIGDNIRNQLREAGVDVAHIVRWNTKNDGSRHSTDAKGTICNGINFTYAGSGVLPSDTTYYRAHTAATHLKPGDFDLDLLFGLEGARVYNTGGIFTLIGPRTADLAVEAAERAAEYGTFVAADVNYRSKVEPDKAKARAINQRLLPHIGMLVGNDTDFADALGYETVVSRGASFEDWLIAYQGTVLKIADDFPNLSIIGTQWRDAHNADVISWGAVLYDTINRVWYTSTLRHNVPIRDRTGGGDSFASGVLAALLKGHDLAEAVEWGAAHGILVQETPGDISMITEDAVVAEVRRARSGGGVRAKR
jgi:2-dehydro-3-deoxygluconokinase